MKTQYFALPVSMDSSPLRMTHWSGSSSWGLDDSSYPEFIAEVGALAMGSATYEWMLRNAEQVVAVEKVTDLFFRWSEKINLSPLSCKFLTSLA